MTSGMSINDYKEYFEQNNFKGNNYETAKFIQFLMGKKTKGKEMETLTGIKHSQITSYKKIINSGKMEDLKNKSISKVFKSIETKLDKKTQAAVTDLISEFEKIPDKFMLGEESDDELLELLDEEEEDERAAWEEEVRRMTLKESNGVTDKADYFISELVDENRVLRRKITKDRDEATRTLEEIKGENEALARDSVSLRHENEELRKENASLIAYKKFFEEMRLKQRELEAALARGTRRVDSLTL